MEAHVHKTIATLRRDGSPRISGIEAKFADGDLWFGSMPAALKALDLRRDPRFALHSGSDDPPGWEGDAKLAGRAVEITDPQARADGFRAIGADEVSDGSHLFRADIDEASVVGLSDSRDHLELQIWTTGGDLRRMRRD